MQINLHYTNFTPQPKIIYFVKVEYLTHQSEEVFTLANEKMLHKKINVKGVKSKTIEVKITLIKELGTHGY